MIPVVVVHGGAGRIAEANMADALAGVRRAAAAGSRALVDGDALTAVLAAVAVLEADPVFNAGYGACFTAAGRVEVDAGVMRGRDGATGAVAAVPELADASTVAAAVLADGRHCLLAGEGAVRFAEARGVGRFGRDAVWTAKAQARWDAARANATDTTGQADTVGAIAIDRDGSLAAACSTGGVLMKLPGRVGDSPIAGAGFYARDDLGAACATGVGEGILRRVGCYDALLRLRGGLPATAAAAAVCADVAALGEQYTCGIILLAPDGSIGVAHHSPHMSHAWIVGDGEIHSGLVAT